MTFLILVAILAPVSLSYLLAGQPVRKSLCRGTREASTRGHRSPQSGPSNTAQVPGEASLTPIHTSSDSSPSHRRAVRWVETPERSSEKKRTSRKQKSREDKSRLKTVSRSRSPHVPRDSRSRSSHIPILRRGSSKSRDVSKQDPT